MSSGSFFGRCWSRARIQADVRVKIHQLKIMLKTRLHHSSRKNEVKSSYWGHKFLIFELKSLSKSHKWPWKWPQMTQDNINLLFTADNKGVFLVIDILYPVIWSQKTSNQIHHPSNKRIIKFKAKCIHFQNAWAVERKRGWLNSPDKK